MLSSCARMVNQHHGLANLADMGQHGHQQVDLAVGRRPQNGAQLRQQHRRIGQAPADGAQAQRQVEVAVLRPVQAVEWLVRADASTLLLLLVRQDSPSASLLLATFMIVGAALVGTRTR